MKLAEALLQDKPIRRKGFKQWCKPEIVRSNRSDYAALPTVCGTDKYTLGYKNMTADDWEVKQEPLSFEFECEWEAERSRGVYPVGEMKELNKVVNSGKRFRVTCVEVVE